MFGINLCKFYFATVTITTVILGTLLNIFEAHLPAIISNSIRYGKFASKEKLQLTEKLEIPKSSFRHFYSISALIYCPLVLYEVFKVYIFGDEPSLWIKKLLDFAYGYERTGTVSATRVFLAVILLALQIFRRFYDTHFVSIFSKKATINLVHYFIGMTYYPAVILIVLSEAPKFADTSEDKDLFHCLGEISEPEGWANSDWSFSGSKSLERLQKIFAAAERPIRIIPASWLPFIGLDLSIANEVIDLKKIGFVETFAVILFLWAWNHQHIATVILANLRKDKKGDVVSQNYQIPTGDWFEHLSSPHCTAEIIMYTALTLLLSNNIGWWYVYAWVISNQTETILLSHWWYQNNFKDFPQSRKAIIPFVY